MAATAKAKAAKKTTKATAKPGKAKAPRAANRAEPRVVLVYAAVLPAKRGLAALGTLWLPWERRGDLARLLTELGDRDDAPRRATWKRVRAATLPYYQALLTALGERRWLTFRGALVEAGHTPDQLLAAVLERGAASPEGQGRVVRLRLAGDDDQPRETQDGEVRTLDWRKNAPLAVTRLLATMLRAAQRGDDLGKSQAALLAQLAASDPARVQLVRDV